MIAFTSLHLDENALCRKKKQTTSSTIRGWDKPKKLKKKERNQQLQQEST